MMLTNRFSSGWLNAGLFCSSMIARMRAVASPWRYGRLLRSASKTSAMLTIIVQRFSLRLPGFSGRPPQNVRAVHDVLLHDLELLLVQLVGLDQHMAPLRNFASVVHQGRKTEF